MSKLSTQWFLGTDPKNKAQHEASIRACTYGFQQLLDIVNRKQQELDRRETSLDQYDSPSWGFKQADTNGRRAVLQELADLLAFINNP